MIRLKRAENVQFFGSFFWLLRSFFPDDSIRVIHTPGHTTDCISVLDEEEGIINVGDNIGDTLDEILPSIETEKDVYLNTILKYKNIDFDTCVSGHNVLLGKAIFDTILKEYV